MKVKVYEDARGEWRWRAVDGNGRIVADGSEGYVDKHACIRAIMTNVVPDFRKQVEVDSPSGYDGKATFTEFI